MQPVAMQMIVVGGRDIKAKRSAYVPVYMHQCRLVLPIFVCFLSGGVVLRRRLFPHAVEGGKSRMWSSTSVSVERSDAVKYTIEHDERTISFREVIAGWKGSEEFREYYIKVLSDSPFAAAFWETPPVDSAALDKPYEFVLVNSPRLARVRADGKAFREHFAKTATETGVVAFDNFRATSRLVAPVPQASNANYAHLLSFLRSASSEQCHQFFQKVGTEFEEQIEKRRTWLSTSGLGVYWLHARFDGRPKYYTFAPYTISPRR